MIIRPTPRNPCQRYFSTSTLSRFDWVHREQTWDVTYTVVSPEATTPRVGTLILFPSTTLLSSREEWRHCAELLADAGYESMLVDWPGWHQRNMPLNWCIEDDIDQKSLVSTFTQFAYTALRHSREVRSNPDERVHVATVGGNGGVHVKRALVELGKESQTFTSLTCFSPSWRFYLTRYVPEGYPRKLARRRAIAETALSHMFVRSKTMFRIYKSKLGLSRLTKRLYEDKIQHNPDLLESKRDVITRDRPLTIDAAMILGQFDPVSSTQDLIKELVGIDPSATDGDHADDSDDDDSLLNLKVPNWVKKSSADDLVAADPDSGPNFTIPTHFVFPLDVDAGDKSELATIREWAEHGGCHISEIPGKLFCHEESPALSAAILRDYFAGLDTK